MHEILNLNDLTLEEQKNIILDALKRPGGLKDLISKYSVLEQNPFENINIHTDEDSFYFELMNHIFELSKLEDKDATNTPFCDFVMECLIDSFAQATPNLGKERAKFELRNWHFVSVIHSLGIKSLLDKDLFQDKLYVDWLKKVKNVYSDNADIENSTEKYFLLDSSELHNLRRIFKYQNTLESLDLNKNFPNINGLFKKRLSDTVLHGLAPISPDAISSVVAQKDDLNDREFLCAVSNLIASYEYSEFNPNVEDRSFESILDRINMRFNHINTWRELRPELIKLNAIGLFEFYNIDKKISTVFMDALNNIHNCLKAYRANVDYNELPELEIPV